MDERALLLKLADCWREAAREASNSALHACYEKRAERYTVLAATTSACSSPRNDQER